MLESPLVTIVVVNYNGAHFLPKLFASLAVQTVRAFDLILVDNGSRDNSHAVAHALCAELQIPFTLIVNDSNRGFATACNQGFAQASGQWIALLNNDAWTEPDWLAQMLAASVRGDRVGMVAAKMLFASRPAMINSAGIALDWAGIAWDWRGGMQDDVAEKDVVEIFGACGGAALYSRQMLDEVGGYDDDFFIYLEDVDLAWRARLAGWRCVFQPQARVYHIHSATTGNNSPFKDGLLARNKIWVIVKDYPSPWLWLLLPILLAYDSAAAIYRALSVRNLAAIRGRLTALRSLPRFWQKRRAIQRRWHNVDNWRSALHPLASPVAILKRYAHLRG